MRDSQLDYGEFRQALRLAALRTVASRAGQMDKGISFEKSPGWITGLNWDIIGACAERYIYKNFDLPWDGGTVNTFLYCLVVGEPPRQRLAGFIRGSDCTKDQWHSVLRSGGMATYNVPQKALKTWEECTAICSLS